MTDDELKQLQAEAQDALRMLNDAESLLNLYVHLLQCQGDQHAPTVQGAQYDVLHATDALARIKRALDDATA